MNNQKTARSIRSVPQRMRGRLSFAIVFLLALVGGIGGLLVGRFLAERPAISQPIEMDIVGQSPLRMLEPRRQLTDFALVDDTGNPFARTQIEGSWTLAFFGFTNCPDVCPTTLATLGTVQEQLADMNLKTIFVTVDPQRDDVETVRRYTDNFSPEILGVTGPEAQIGALARQLGVLYTSPPASGPHAGHYQIDHSTSLALIDPDAKVAGQFAEAGDAKAMLIALQEVIGKP